MIEKLIHFIITYNSELFWASGALFCFFAAWAIYKDYFSKESGSISSDTAEIEEMLRRMLSQTNAAIARTEVMGDAADGVGANGAPSAGGASGAVSSAELTAIKAQLEEKVKIIEELKQEVANTKNDKVSEELMAKIKILESKLSEYEIIEDDIADLSHYKDENARLKKELEALRQNGPALVDAFAAAVADGGPASAVAETAPEVMQPPVETQKISEPAKLDDAIANIQAGLDVDTDTPAAASSEEQSDIFAEFTGDEMTEDPLAELGEIDTSRMLEELKDLDIELDASALDEAPDVDKMAEEAVSLLKDDKS